MNKRVRGQYLTDEAWKRLDNALKGKLGINRTAADLAAVMDIGENSALKLYNRTGPADIRMFRNAFAALGLDFDPHRDLADAPDSSPVETEPQPTQGFAELRKNYLDFLIRKHSTVDPRGIMQTERGINLPLDEVYVSLTAEKRAVHMREYLPEGFSPNEQDDTDELALEHWKPKQEMAVRSVPVELDEALRQHGRLIFLGDPGAGKTTLLRYLALKFAQAQRDGIDNVADNEGRIYGAAKLPIIVRVSEFADAFTKDKNLSVRDFLPRCHCGDLGIPESELKSFYETEIFAGNTLILLDGLDEVISAADRAEIGRRIDSFVTGLSGSGENRVIVTSRIMGYREAALSAQFEEHTLRDMSVEQIERFLQRWCPAYEKHRDPNGAESERQKRAEEEAKALLDSIKANEGVKRLATNPLLLTILALIRRNGASLPKRRVELYRIASETLLKDWQIGRGIQEENLVQPEEAKELLAPLAYWMHCHEPTGLIEERDARDVLTRVVMRTRGLKTKHEAEKFVTDFLRRVREHTGVFVERAPGKYGFMHLTFEEYFAALYLVDDEDDDIIERIQKLKHHPRWEEPIRLAIAQEKPKKAAKFIRKGILAPKSDYEKWLYRDCIFGARCIGDCIVVSEIRSLLDEVSMMLLPCTEIKDEFPGYCDGLRDVVAVVISELESEYFVNFLVKLCNEEDEDVRFNAALALSRLGSEQSITALVKLCNEEDEHIRATSALALGRLGNADSYVIAALVKLCNDEDRDVRSNAASALGSLENADSYVIIALVKLCSDEDGDVFYSAVAALDRLGSEQSITALVKLCSDEDEHIRATSAAALGRLGNADSYVIAALVKLCSDEDGDVRSNAASALGRLGNADSDILTLLYDMLETWSDDADNAWNGLSASAIVMRTKEVEAWMAEQKVV